MSKRISPEHDPSRGLWPLSTKEKVIAAVTVATILIAAAGVEVIDGAFADQPSEHSTPVK